MVWLIRIAHCCRLFLPSAFIIHSKVIAFCRQRFLSFARQPVSLKFRAAESISDGFPCRPSLQTAVSPNFKTSLYRTELDHMKGLSSFASAKFQGIRSYPVLIIASHVSFLSSIGFLRGISLIISAYPSFCISIPLVHFNSPEGVGIKGAAGGGAQPAFCSVSA